MQRVLHIVGKMDRAGAETMIMNLYRHIDRSKVQFDFITFTKDQGDYDEEILSLGGNIFPIVAVNPFARMKFLKLFLLNHREYQIVHGHTLFSNSFHMYAAKLAGVKNRISHSHSTNDISNSKYIKYIYQGVSKYIIKKYSTQFIACGVEASKFLFPTQKDVLILPNSINIDLYQTIGENNRDYINEKFSIKEETLKIVQIGRLQHVKNHLYSIRIAKSLKDKGIDFKMFFVGQGNLENRLKEEVSSLDLLDHIVFTGVRTDIAHLMAGADVMLMPSFYEGFPVVLVESQAVGLRAVISDTISKEVDLEVGMVNFVSLEDSVDKWIEHLLTTSGKKTDRQFILKSKGFDISYNANLLQLLYKKSI